MATFYGIIAYEILENGNLLNGVYTNNQLRAPNNNSYNIDSEIARKIPNDNNTLEGNYDCRYIETILTPFSDSLVHCKLAITRMNEVYEFRWTSPTRLNWVGIGLRAGNNHIAVSYTYP